MSTTNENFKNSIVIGDDVVTTIPLGFNYIENDDRIELIVTMLEVATGILSELVLDTDYTISGSSIVLTTALPTGFSLLIERDVTNIQHLDYIESEPFPAEVHENLMDRVFMSLAELKGTFSRVPLLGKFVTGKTLSLPEPVDKSLLVWQGDTGELSNYPVGDIEVLRDESQAARDAALAAQVGAETAETDAQQAVTDAQAEVTLAQTARTGAETAETNAQGHELAAQAAAADALDAANASRWQDVVPVTFADSPVNIEAADNGNLYTVDTSAGAVVFNLPARGDLDLSLPWQIGVIKKTGDLNTVTTNPDGIETIDGVSSVASDTINSGYVFIPDDDTDDWATIPYASATGGAAVTSVAGKTGAVTLVKGDVGLDQVDNTSDINKPVSTAQQSALDLKQNTVPLYFQSNFRTYNLSNTVTMTATDGYVQHDAASLDAIVLLDPTLYPRRIFYVGASSATSTTVTDNSGAVAYVDKPLFSTPFQRVYAYYSNGTAWQQLFADVETGLTNLQDFTGNGDGTTVTFSLGFSPASTDSMIVTVDGVFQEFGQWSLSGSDITFATAPSTGINNIVVKNFAAVAIGVPGDGTVSTVKLANDVKTKYRTKSLSSDITADGNISDLQFTGLVVGEVYKYELTIFFNQSITGSVGARIYNNASGTSNLLGEPRTQDNASIQFTFSTKPFVATSSTVRAEAVFMQAGDAIVGTGTLGDTHATLYKFPLYEEDLTL